MMNEPMKMLIFFVALCFLLFCSDKHLCFTLKSTKQNKKSLFNILLKVTRLSDKRGGGSFCELPRVNVDQEEQSLHGDDVDPLAVKPGDFEHLQVGEAQDEQGEHEAGGVEDDGEDGELHPVAAAVARLQGAGRVHVAVADPGEEQRRQGEGEGVQPRVAHHDQRVLVAHLGGVAEREHHRDPPVNAERCHAQHGVGGEESLQKAHRVASAVPKRLLLPDNPHQSGRHVEHGDEDVAEGQVHGEHTGHLPADLGAVDET